MQYFPTTCIDGFFENPDSIVKLANDKAHWQPSDNGSWPGVRSQPLHEIDHHVYLWVMNKYLSAFFSETEKNEYNISFRSTSMFQKIPVSKEEDWREGWIHTDHPDVHTFIIYLTPGANGQAGTSLYSKKNVLSSPNFSKIKKQVYLNEIPASEGKEWRKKSNEQFELDTTFANKYNRCIGFDSSLWHGVQNFDTGTEDRLTLITFFHHISCGPFPLQRVRSNVMIKD